MDLTSFTSKKNSKEEIIEDNKDVIISKKDNKKIFKFKNKESIEKYEGDLFFAPTKAKYIENTNDLQVFFEESQKAGVEGLMVKSLERSYQVGSRTGAMAKLKETKEDLDLVIVGAEHGKGKRAGFYSSFIVAVKDDEEFLEVGKVSSGIKELGEDGASLKKLTSLLEPIKISEENNVIKFEPKVVIQVRYQEIQKSSLYSSGFALRFPRIISLRDDKNLDEINSVDDLTRFI